MMTTKRLVWVVAAIGTALNLLVLYCVRATLGLENAPDTIPVLPGILHLTYLPPISDVFSIFHDSKPILILIGILVILLVYFVTVFFSWRLAKSNKEIMKPLQIGIGLLLAGSISNTLERIQFEGVSVYIHIQLFEIPIFNLADIFIYLGWMISIISIIFLGLKFAVSGLRQ